MKKTKYDHNKLNVTKDGGYVVYIIQYNEVTHDNAYHGGGHSYNNVSITKAKKYDTLLSAQTTAKALSKTYKNDGFVVYQSILHVDQNTIHGSYGNFSHEKSMTDFKKWIPPVFANDAPRSMMSPECFKTLADNVRDEELPHINDSNWDALVVRVTEKAYSRALYIHIDSISHIAVDEGRDAVIVSYHNGTYAEVKMECAAKLMAWWSQGKGFYDTA